MISATLKLLSSWVTWLNLVSAVFVFGYKPKACPRHGCFPQTEVVTVEQTIVAGPHRLIRRKKKSGVV